MREITTPEGKLVLAEAAVAALAASAALLCPGVVGLAGRRLQDELVDLLREPRDGGADGRGVEVELDEGQCRITWRCLR